VGVVRRSRAILRRAKAYASDSHQSNHLQFKPVSKTLASFLTSQQSNHCLARWCTGSDSIGPQHTTAPDSDSIGPQAPLADGARGGGLATSQGPENPDGSLNKLHFTQRYLRLVGVSDNGSDHEDDSDDDNNEAFQKDEDSDDSYSR
jgi:hypothetical protein